MSKKRKQFHGPELPPLVPLAHSANGLPGPPVIGMKLRREQAMKESFADYVARKPADLDARPVGTWPHFEESYGNAVLADYAVREMAQLIHDRGGSSLDNARANDAGVNLLLASHLLNTAAIVHIRPDETTHAHGLILTRSALECVGRAALLAHGQGDEMQRWQGELRIEPWECIDALKPIAARANSKASSPRTVYDWLCNYTHMSIAGIRRMQSKDPGIRDESYCGHAYVSWLTAVLAEDVTGIPDLARYPSALPSKLPWD